MSSGLAFEEVYRPLADATDMLYGARDFGAFAAQSHLEAMPDHKWSYSSGTANIIARIVRYEAEKTDCIRVHFDHELEEVDWEKQNAVFAIRNNGGIATYT